jgi:hypothetical protein
LRQAQIKQRPRIVAGALRIFSSSAEELISCFFDFFTGFADVFAGTFHRVAGSQGEHENKKRAESEQFTHQKLLRVKRIKSRPRRMNNRLIFTVAPGKPFGSSVFQKVLTS